MAEPAIQTVSIRSRALDAALQLALIIGASFFVAFCARIAIPIPGTPVPLTVQNLGVLLVGLALGSRRGFAALALYLLEGVSGLPVFSPFGKGGILQLVGPTGGYLIAYPFVAGLAGYILERGKAVLTRSLGRALSFGLYWFIFAEVIKVMVAAGTVRSWQSFFPKD